MVPLESGCPRQSDGSYLPAPRAGFQSRIRGCPQALGPVCASSLDFPLGRVAPGVRRRYSGCAPFARSPR
eukprot:12143322-Alexandrium_andersonii.AAC.1